MQKRIRSLKHGSAEEDAQPCVPKVTKFGQERSLTAINEMTPASAGGR